MLITSQGVGHYTKGINNQDFGIETPKMLLILDGCSDCRFSEVGTRLFAQLFSRKEGYDRVDLFEKNAKEVFEEILEMMKKYYPNIEEFIMNNLLFTIFACFETEDKFIVKYFGDGYILTQNTNGCLSYIRLSYGKTPPYLAYRYCDSYKDTFGAYDFKFQNRYVLKNMSFVNGRFYYTELMNQNVLCMENINSKENPKRIELKGISYGGFVSIYNVTAKGFDLMSENGVFEVRIG